MWLLHGTTRARAESIVRNGPDVSFVEPGDDRVAENFSFTAEGMPSALGDSYEYARGKARAFPAEFGAALLAVEVSDEIVRLAAVEYLSLFTGLIEFDQGAELSELVVLCSGVIQFDPGPALNALLATWGTLTKEIRGVP